MLKKLSLLPVLLILFFFRASAQVKAHKKPQHRSLRTTLTDGKKVYTQICLACHMADGGGVPHMNPPLINTPYVLGDKTTLVKIVLNGFKEDVEINGKTYSNNMTPHAELKDRQIADVLTYVRKSFGNKASPVTAVEVKKIRASNKK